MRKARGGRWTAGWPTSLVASTVKVIGATSGAVSPSAGCIHKFNDRSVERSSSDCETHALAIDRGHAYSSSSSSSGWIRQRTPSVRNRLNPMSFRRMASTFDFRSLARSGRFPPVGGARIQSPGCYGQRGAVAKTLSELRFVPFSRGTPCIQQDSSNSRKRGLTWGISPSPLLHSGQSEKRR